MCCGHVHRPQLFVTLDTERGVLIYVRKIAEIRLPKILSLRARRNPNKRVSCARANAAPHQFRAIHIAPQFVGTADIATRSRKALISLFREEI